MSAYGSDLSCVSDLDSGMGLFTGPKIVAEAVARRLTTPRGGLFYDPNYGTDLRRWLNAAIDEKDIPDIRAEIETEAELDERVATADVSVEFDRSSASIKAKIELTLVDDRTFRFTLSVSQLSAAILTE